MRKRWWRLRYGTTSSEHVNVVYARKRRNVERVRRWWVDAPAPALAPRDPRERWARIDRVRGDVVPEELPA